MEELDSMEVPSGGSGGGSFPIGWVIWIVIAGIGAVWLGRTKIFLDVECPRLQYLILYGVAGSLTVLAALWAAITGNDSIVAKLLSVIFVVFGVIVGTTVIAGALSHSPDLQRQYCPAVACKQAELVRQFVEDEKWDAVEEVARSCLESVPSTQREKECQEECKYYLSVALYEKAAPEDLPSWERDREQACQQALRNLDTACKYAEETGHGDLVRGIHDRQQRLKEACEPPLANPTPTLPLYVEILHVRSNDQEAIVDVRVLQGDQSLQGLSEEDFRFIGPNGPIPFKLEFRSSDDPVCVVVVVDNSGSVYDHIEQLHEAIDSLNRLRKPSDELGMVVFGGHNQIFTQAPEKKSLDYSIIDASGEKTALWDGLFEGIVVAGQCSYPERYVLLITDGKDNDSRKLRGDDLERAAKIVEYAASANVSICTIGVQSDALEEEPLRAVAYGCDYYPADDFDAVATLLVNTFGYLHDFYRLRFDNTARVIVPGQPYTLQILDKEEVTVEFPR